LSNFILAGGVPPIGMLRSFQSVGAPLMQPYQQLQAAPVPVPVPQPCKKLISCICVVK
jgi:hypothetical protein